MQEPSEYLFEPMWSSPAFSVCMKRWCPKAGIPKRIRWKDLARHTYISELGNAGAAKTHTNALVGHSGNSQIVERVYQHLDPNALAETVAKLPSVFGPSKVCQHPKSTTGNHEENPGTPREVNSAKTRKKQGKHIAYSPSKPMVGGSNPSGRAKAYARRLIISVAASVSRAT